MPKSKSKRKPKTAAATPQKLSWGGRAGGEARRINLVMAAVALLAAVGLGAYWFLTSREESAFLELAAQGQHRLGDVVSLRDLSGGHGQHGEVYNYPDLYPTSGRHDPLPTAPGFYATQQAPGRLVHALEHGHVVIYYDRPDPAALTQLKDWTALYGGKWDGVVVTPMPGLGPRFVLTAWTKQLHLERFDAAAAAAFVDAYRGRGPEHPVR